MLRLWQFRLSLLLATLLLTRQCSIFIASLIYFHGANIKFQSDLAVRVKKERKNFDNSIPKHVLSCSRRNLWYKVVTARWFTKTQIYVRIYNISVAMTRLDCSYDDVIRRRKLITYSYPRWFRFFRAIKPCLLNPQSDVVRNKGRQVENDFLVSSLRLMGLRSNFVACTYSALKTFSKLKNMC